MRALGSRGMVASPHYLATGAGVSVLRRGGNAVDAALATNAVLAVVTPYLCGIGGDLFALGYAGGNLYGLNGSGRAPAEATRERVAALAGEDRMPARGPLPITVPGCVDAWARLHTRFGRLPFADIFGDAIRYASEGFAVSAEFSNAIERSAAFLHPDTPARETFLPGGKPPAEGTIFRQPRLARTLQIIAEEGPDAYYRGEIGGEIARAVQAVGGLLSGDDLAAHTAEWVEPLSLTYRGITIYELPPNSQGVIALLMLNILQHLPAEWIRQDGERLIHLVAEAARLAYADRETHLTDGSAMRVAPEEFLSDAYGRDRAALIGEHVRGLAPTGEAGGTIYLCAADSDGNLVSLIESNYMGIGSGVMGGDTGVMLHNRGAWFSLDPNHINVIAPRKRTLHTLMPGMAFKGDRPWLVFGTMGGSMQAQIHVEILLRLIDLGMPLDRAIAAPRFDAVVGDGAQGPALLMEDRFPPGTVEGLRRRGHDVSLTEPFTSQMGHAHAIEVLDDRVYVGASDPRTDSLALGY